MARTLARNTTAMAHKPSNPHRYLIPPQPRRKADKTRKDNIMTTISPFSRQSIKEDLLFQQWMKNVDLIIQRKTGLSAYDLPDYCYRDAYEDDIAPLTAANRAIKAALEGC
jgi:hypothetical protein